MTPEQINVLKAIRHGEIYGNGTTYACRAVDVTDVVKSLIDLNMLDIGAPWEPVGFRQAGRDALRVILTEEKQQLTEGGSK